MSETPAEELYLRGYRPASKTWNGLLRWLPVSLPAEDDVLYIRADLYEAQAAEIAALREQLARSCDDERADPEGLACPIGANLNLAERRITAQAAEIETLKTSRASIDQMRERNAALEAELEKIADIVAKFREIAAGI